MIEQESQQAAFDVVKNVGGLNAVEKDMLWMSYDLGLVHQANLLMRLPSGKEEELLVWLLLSHLQIIWA